jgi:hypothetical protein
MRFWLLLLSLAAAPACAQSGIRGGTTDGSLNFFVVGSKQYAFENGASARNDGGLGMGATISRNLNDYFAVGVEGTYTRWDYRATVAPGAGNAGGSFETTGKMETASVRFNATWNLLARPVTPFITAGAGVIFLDANIDPAVPANACWVYPWYGQVCGGTVPTNALSRFNYAAAAGLRYDLPGNQGFLRAMVGGEWIAISEATSPVGYVQFRADFGVKF